MIFYRFLLCSFFFFQFSNPLVHAQKISRIIFITENKNSLSLETCKLYISNFNFKKQGQSLFKEKDSVHLIDVLHKNRNQIKFILPSDFNPDEISFGIGVDSIINKEGVKGGDLDPVKGMYWTWQTGYINFKIEGTRDSGNSKEKFEYHIGGFSNSNYSYREVSMKIIKWNQLETEILIDIDQFLNNSFKLGSKSLMSPGPQAFKLSDLFTTCFYLK
ncbi:MAG: MbnP family protein [Bacteroidota bacterium]|jgi:hypothetical protein